MTSRCRFGQCSKERQRNSILFPIKAENIFVREMYFLLEEEQEYVIIPLMMFGGNTDEIEI